MKKGLDPKGRALEPGRWYVFSPRTAFPWLFVGCYVGSYVDGVCRRFAHVVNVKTFKDLPAACHDVPDRTDPLPGHWDGEVSWSTEYFGPTPWAVREDGDRREGDTPVTAPARPTAEQYEHALRTMARMLYWARGARDEAPIEELERSQDRAVENEVARCLKLAAKEALAAEGPGR